MDSSDDDESKTNKLPQTPSKRKPKNDRTPKKKLKTEQADGSRNTCSVRAGQYGHLAVADLQRSPSPPNSPPR
ncbi:hypothetical protein HCN44_005499 [Aphidius gifuensis]|uniref:Uncharacterized protein n=1 Tax=Aphidius gifuensis TaxID=684658 RepID=A0A834Y5N4_APHGI|nr:hypothetical protein HCN44_005499 [Aphidius gifuensis]